MNKGWWRLTWTTVEGDLETLSDSTKENIGELIKQGYVEGQIVEEIDDD